MKKLLISILLSGMTGQGLLAEDSETALYQRMIAAGYKGVFTCGGLFSGGKSLEAIQQDELSGIRADLQDLVSSLPDAVVDLKNKTVQVTYDASMPPRMWKWRPQLGCVQLPAGSRLSDAAALPTLTLDKPKHTTREWPMGDPEKSVGMSMNRHLNNIVSRAFNANYYNDGAEEGQKTSSILIATPKEIITEWYKKDHSPWTAQRTWSAAKSVTASVVGVAVQQKIMSVKKAAPIPEWQHPNDPRRQITLENLLQMSSGLHSTAKGYRTDKVYWGGVRVGDTATREPLEAIPGTRWHYANNDTLLLTRALREAIKTDYQTYLKNYTKMTGANAPDAETIDSRALDAYLRFPYESLFYKIGMLNTWAETDWGSNFIMSSQVWTTPRDLARLGILYLRDGRLLPTDEYPNGEQILPKGWATYVSTPAKNQPTTGSWNYGAQFWIREGLGYAARGNRGQIVMILPDYDLVIVRRGYDRVNGTGFDMPAFAADVIKALKLKPTSE